MLFLSVWELCCGKLPLGRSPFKVTPALTSKCKLNSFKKNTWHSVVSFNDIFVMIYFFRLLSLRPFNFVLLSCTQPVFFIAYKVLVSSFTDICGFLIYTECARILGGFIHAINYKFLNIRTRVQQCPCTVPICSTHPTDA